LLLALRDIQENLKDHRFGSASHSLPHYCYG